MTTITLDQLVDSGVKHARHLLLEKREKQLQAFYTLIDAKGEIAVLPCVFNNDFEKDVTVATVKATAELTGAVMAVYISEAWMLKLPKGVALEDAPKPSQSPDRIECVHVLATDGTTIKARALQMVRDRPGGKLMSLIPMPELEQGTSYIGRMIDGIIPPRKEALQ